MSRVRARPDPSDDDCEPLKVTRRTNKEREVAMLLADQRNHSSVEDLQKLRSDVKNIFENGGDDEAGGGGGGGRRRGRRVMNRLPDMLGVIRDGGTNRRTATNAATKGGIANGGSASLGGGSGVVVEEEEERMMSVLNSHFHATRWRLLVPSSLSSATSSSAEATIAPPVPQWARSTMANAPHPLKKGDDDEASNNIADAFRNRRASEDAVGELEHHREQHELRGLLAHRSDSVTLRNDNELQKVLNYLKLVIAPLPQELSAFGGAIIELAKNCGFPVVQDLLEAYADTRTTVTACDRWLTHLEEDVNNPLASAATKNKAREVVIATTQTQHGCCVPKELLLLMVYGIVSYRTVALMQCIHQSTEMSSEQKSLFGRLVQVHPFSPYGLLPKEQTTTNNTSNSSGTHSDNDAPGYTTAAVAAASAKQKTITAFSILLTSFLSERTRVRELTASLNAEATVNVPLQRQTAKYDSIRKSIEALSSRFDIVDDEERHLGDELAVQLEVSSRLSEFVQCGAVMDDVIASQPTSFIMESVLWTLPPSVASVQHREIEEALEKFLWGHPYALMSDDLITAEYVHATRKQLLVNLALRRAVTRKMTILAALRKLTESDLHGAVEAKSEDGVLLPEV